MTGRVEAVWSGIGVGPKSELEVEPDIEVDRPTEGKLDIFGDNLSPVPNKPIAGLRSSPSSRLEPRGRAGGGCFSCSERFHPKLRDPIFRPFRLIDPDRDLVRIGPLPGLSVADVPSGERWS